MASSWRTEPRAEPGNGLPPAVPRPEGTDDLLLGCLALQHGLISCKDLACALALWNAGSHKPFLHLLIECGRLSVSDVERLTALVEPTGDAIHEQTRPISLVSGPADPDAPRDISLDGTIEFFDDPALPSGAANACSDLATPPADLSGQERYRILRPLAKGGLGAVFVALDTQFNREVAVKLIRDDLLQDKITRDRFLIEAEIAGSLEHPGIVPVYGLGRTTAGTPYYAMRLIRGETLKDALLRFHSDARGLNRSVEFRRLLWHFIQVCKAVHYAHSRGVLHRDLKPSNIVIGMHGETFVVDWGLAKAVGDLEPILDSDERPVQTSNSDHSTNAHGSMIGTPSFMSPELLAGGNTRLGISTDIYSLGVTLYAILTGSNAFEESQVSSLLAKVRSGVFQAPRKVKPELDVVLESICLKAMAFNPEQRYASTLQLADDLEHWLADEPVTSVPEPASNRIRRWERRNRMLIRVGGASLALLVLVATTAAFVINSLRHEERNLRLIATQQSQKAFQQTLEVQEMAAEILLDEGLRRCDDHQVAEGLLTMASSLHLAQRQYPHLEQLIRTNIAAWQPRLSTLRFQIDTRNKVRAAFSPDGTLFATASDDRTARVWDWQTGQPVTPTLLHGNEVNTVAFDPDGLRIVTSCNDHLARIWNARSGSLLARPLPHRGWVMMASFSPDGRSILTASLDGSARLWNSTTGEPLTPPLPHAKGVLSAVFSPDGSKVATASLDRTARLWNAHTGDPLTPPLQHQATILQVAFDPTGQRVATASADGTARVWNAHTGDPLTPPLPHRFKVNTAVFSPDGLFLLSASDDATAALWHIATGTLRRSFEGHRGAVMSASFSPDGLFIATASQDQTAALWNCTTGSRIGSTLRHRDWVYQALFHPNHRQILTASRDFSVRAWNIDGVAHPRLQLDHPKLVTTLNYHPLGQRLATGSVDGLVRVWDLSTGSCLLSADPGCGPITHLAYSPDGSTLLVSGQNPVARSLDAQTGSPGIEFKGHHSRINTIQIDPSGKRVLTASDDGLAIVWDASTGLELHRLLGSGLVVRSATFSPDGQFILTASNDRTARLWNALSGQQIGAPIEHSTDVTWAELSPDGRTILTGAQENVAHLWSATTRTPIGRSLLHNGFVYRASFSPNGSRILSGSQDGTARLWDALTGRPLGPPISVGGNVQALAFHPTRQEIAVGGRRNVLVLDFLNPSTGASATEIQDRLERITGLRRTPQGEFIALDVPTLKSLSNAPPSLP